MIKLYNQGLQNICFNKDMYTHSAKKILQNDGKSAKIESKSRYSVTLGLSPKRHSQATEIHLHNVITKSIKCFFDDRTGLCTIRKPFKILTIFN